MIVYFSTVFRTAPLDQGGELIKLDWRQKKVVAKVPIMPVDPMIPDPNPRGGTRGGRGILLDDEHVYVASYHTIHVFDHRLRPVRVFSNPLFADLHELAWDGDSIWASSTVLDGAVLVDKVGNTLASWWPREDPVVSRRLGVQPLPLDKGVDNRLSYLGRSHVEPGHTHLNTVTLANGRPLVMLNRFGCVIRLHPTEVLIHDPKLEGAHNLLVMPDGHLLVNDTNNYAILVFDCSGALRRRIDLNKFWPVRKILLRFAFRRARIWIGSRSPSFRLQWFLVKDVIGSRPVFVRGLCETRRGTILVGISPAALLEIDWTTGKLLDYFCYSDNVNVAVHGLKAAR